MSSDQNRAEDNPLTEKSLQHRTRPTYKPKDLFFRLRRLREDGLRLDRKDVSAVFRRTVPISSWLPNYNWNLDFPNDLMAGITVGIILIPTALAFGAISTLNPVVGLYSSLLPQIIYACLGTSKHAVIGASALSQIMLANLLQSEEVSSYINTTSAAVMNAQPLDTSADDSGNAMYRTKLNVAMTFSLLVGLTQLFLGIVRFGGISVLMSDPMISGYTFGCTWHVMSSQFEHMLGLHIPRGAVKGPFMLLKAYWFMMSMPSSINVATFMVGSVSVFLIVLLRLLSDRLQPMLKYPLPSEVLVLIFVGFLSYYFEFEKLFDVAIVKEVPGGLPELSRPDVGIVWCMMPIAILTGVTLFSIHIAAIKSVGNQHNNQIEPNQELIAFGVANIAGSFFSSTVIAVSISRTALQASIGRTQLAMIIATFIVLLGSVYLAPLLEPLPQALLAAIVTVALNALFSQILRLPRLWRESKQDAFVWIVSCASVIFFGLELGLAGGLVFNSGIVLLRMFRPQTQVIGSVAGTDAFKDALKYEVETFPGIEIVRFCGPLFYGALPTFTSMISKSILKFNADVCIGTKAQSSSEIGSNSEPAQIKNEPQLVDDPTPRDDVDLNREKDGMSPAGLSEGFHRDHLIQGEGQPTSSMEAPPRGDDVDVLRLEHPPDVISAPPRGVIIVDLGQVFFTDIAGIESLVHSVSVGSDRNVDVVFACCQGAQRFSF